jgi:hypothetical protein
VNLVGSPVDSKKLKYQWSFDFLPAASQLTDSDIANANTDAASFFPDTLGKYGLKFDVHDCSTSFCSKTVEVQVVCNDIGDTVSAGKDVNAEFNGGEVEICGKPTFEREVSYLWSLARVSGFKIPTVYANAAGVDLKATTGNVVDLDTAVVQVAGEWSAISNVTYEWTFKETPAASNLNNEHIEFRRGMALNVGSARFVPDVVGSYELLLVAKNGEAAAYDTMIVAAGGGAAPAAAAPAVAAPAAAATAAAAAPEKDVVSTSDVVVTDALSARSETLNNDVVNTVDIGAMVGAALGVVAVAFAAVLVSRRRKTTQGQGEVVSTPKSARPDFSTPDKEDEAVSL